MVEGLRNHGLDSGQIGWVLDQVFDEGEPFNGVLESPDDALAVVESYLEGDDLSGLPQLLKFDGSFGILFDTALRVARERKRQEDLFDLLLSCDRDWWDSVAPDAEGISRSLDHRDISALLASLKKVGASRTEPAGMSSFLGLLSADRIWHTAVSYYVEHGDFLRAFDLVKKALIGFKTDSTEDLGLLREASTESTRRLLRDRLLRVTPEIAASLTTLAYDAMCEAAVIPPVVCGSVELVDPFVKAGKQRVLRAGFVHALPYFVEQEGSVQSIYSTDQRKPWILKREGGMLLLIAHHFRAKH